MPSVQNKKKEHVHKLKRHSYETGNKIYFCVLPDCKYKVKPGLALGKRAICWRCGNEFLMNEYSIRLAKPHCEDCHKSKDAPDSIPLSDIPANAHLDTDAHGEVTVVSNEPVLSLAERLKKATEVEDEEI